MAEFQLSKISNIPLKHARILRGPHQWAFDLTNKCNFRCLHCFNRSGENYIMKEELKDNEVLKFIKDVVKMKPFNFCFCGGEPLLRKDVLCKSARILSEVDSMVSLVTNGSLVTNKIAKELFESGVNNVQISLDGAKAETHERLRQYKGSFELAVRAISHFREVGVKDISIAFTPTSFNCREFEETFYLVRKLDVSEIRAQPIMILGRTQLHLEELLPTPLQYRELVKTITLLQEKCGPGIIEWGDPVDHLIRFRTLAKHCVNMVDIRANGDIIPSPYLPLTVGNIRRHSISEYWDAGLVRIWELPVVKEFAEKIQSVLDFGKKEEGTPTVWFDKNIKLDIIDDNLFKGGN
ncbi:MAG: radical SAM protein [bacterium]|nr:radical SAM protein [bacterium]